MTTQNNNDKIKPTIRKGCKIKYYYNNIIRGRAEAISVVSDVLDYSVMVLTPWGEEEVYDEDIIEVIE